MSGRSLVFTVVGVLVIAGAALGVSLLLDRSDTPTLPDELAGLPARDTEAALGGADGDEADAERVASAVEAQRSARERVSERISDVFDGAGADVRGYYDADNERTLTVVAVAADAGPLLPDSGTFDDPALLKIAYPRVEWVEQGDDECLLHRTEIVAADDEDAEEKRDEYGAVTCQRTSGDLTVRVSATGEPSMEDTLDFLDDAWEAVS